MPEQPDYVVEAYGIVTPPPEPESAEDEETDEEGEED
jgi:hypothetical protein